MSLKLTGKGSILDAIGGAANTVANAGIAGAKDIGDLVGEGTAAITGNTKAEQNASNAISNNDSNLTNGNVATNLGGLAQDTGLTQAAKSFVNTGAGLATDIVNREGGTNQTSEQAIGGGPLGGITNWASDNGTINEGTKRNVIGNTVQTAVNLATLGKGKALEQGAEDLAKPYIGDVAARLFGGGTAAGAYGAGSGASNAIETAKTPGQAALDIVKPGLENAAFGVGGGLLTKAPAGVDAAKNSIKPVYAMEDPSIDKTPAIPPDNSLSEGETKAKTPTPNPTTYGVSKPEITPTPTNVPIPEDLAKSNQAAQVLDANIQNPGVDWSKVSGATKELKLKTKAIAEHLQAQDKLERSFKADGGLMKAINDAGGIERNNTEFDMKEYPSHILQPKGRGMSLDEMAEHLGYDSSDELHNAIKDSQFRERQLPRAKVLSQYKVEAEQLIRSHPKEFDNVGARADAEKAYKQWADANKQTGYDKALPKGANAKPFIKALHDRINSPEYAIRNTAGALLEDTRNTLKGVKAVRDTLQRQYNAMTKRGQNLDEATRRAVSDQLRTQNTRYNKLVSMEREQANDYSRKAQDLDAKHPSLASVTKKGVMIKSKVEPAETKIPVRVVSHGAEDQAPSTVAKTTTSPDASKAESIPEPTGPNLNEGAFGAEDQAKLNEGIKAQQDEQKAYEQNAIGNASILGSIKYRDANGRGLSDAEIIDNYMKATGSDLDEAKKAYGLIEDDPNYEKAGDINNNSYIGGRDADGNEHSKIANEDIAPGTKRGLGKVLLRSSTMAEHLINKALLRATSYGDHLAYKLDDANNLWRKVDDADKPLADQLRDHSIDQVVAKAKDPEALRAYANRAKDIEDYIHAARIASDPSDITSYRLNYGAGLHFIDKNDIPRTIDQYEGKEYAHQLQRNDGTYEGIEKSTGLKRSTQDFNEDLAKDVVAAQHYIAPHSLLNGLRQAFTGDDVAYGKATTSAPVALRDFDGVYASKAIADRINSRAAYVHDTNDVMGKINKGYDVANQTMKNVKLSMGGFHNINEMLNQMALNPSGTGAAARALVDPQFYRDQMNEWDANGTMEKALHTGLTIGDKDVAGPEFKGSSVVTSGKYNPIRVMHDALFDRQIPFSKMQVFERYTKGLDLNDPNDYDKMRGVSRGINNTFGGINRLVDGLSPKRLNLIGKVTLAADYNEGQIRTLLSSLYKGGTEGRMARQVVVGRAVILATPGVIQAIATHKIGNNPEQIAKFVGNQLLNPTVQTGYKTTGGVPKQISLISGIVNKADRAIAPAFNKENPNKASGIESELSGNLSPAASTIEEEAKNKDYYGNPMHGQGLNAAEDIGQLANSAAPIPFSPGARALEGYKGLATNPVVRTLAGGQSKISPGEAGIDISGIGRVAANPTSPEMVILNSRQMIAGSLNASDKAQLNQVEPGWSGQLNKAQQAQVYANPDYEINKWNILRQNTNVYNALVKQNAVAVKNGEPSNPLLTLPKNDYNIVTEYEFLKHADEGPDANNTAAVIYAQNKAMINKFENDNATYGNQMNALYAKTSGTKGSNSPIETVGGVPTYNATPQETALANQYYTMTDANSTSAQRAQFLTDNPQLVQLMNVQLQAQNKIRAQQGEPQLKPFPQAPAALNTWMNNYTAASKTERTALRTANPAEYNAMSQYMATVDQYDLAKTLGQTQFQGDNVNQSQLKEEYDLGQYDINPEVAGDVTTYSLDPQAAYATSQSTGANAEVNKLLNDIERTGAKEAVKYAGKKAYIAKPHKNKVFIRSAKALPQTRAPIKIKAKVTQLA